MIALAAIPFAGPFLAKAAGALLSPLGRVALIAAFGFGIYGFGWQRGKAKAETRCETAALRAEIATLKRDRDIARVAEADAATRAAAIEAANAADQRIVEEVRNAPSNPACRLSPADALRLQSIGGTRR